VTFKKRLRLSQRVYIDELTARYHPTTFTTRLQSADWIAKHLAKPYSQADYLSLCLWNRMPLHILCDNWLYPTTCRWISEANGTKPGHVGISITTRGHWEEVWMDNERWFVKLEQHSFPARHFFPQERFFSALGFFNETAMEVQGFWGIFYRTREGRGTEGIGPSLGFASLV
jgi:hypothetical protein